MFRRKRLIWIIPLAILGVAAFIALGGEVVRLLWNWLLPSLFGWRHITFWEAVGLLALCRILFGGGGIRGPRGPSLARRRIRERWNERMAERWAQMSPEEREKFRQSFRGRCGPFEPPTATPTP